MLARNQDFAIGKGLNPPKKFKLGRVMSKVVCLKRIIDGGLWAEPPATGGYGGLVAKLPAKWRFFVIFWKKQLF